MANKNYATQSSLGNYQPRANYNIKKGANYNPQGLPGYNKSYLPLAQNGINLGAGSPAGYFKAPKQGLEKALGGEGSNAGDIRGDDNILNLLGANTYSPAGYTIVIVYQPQLRDEEDKAIDINSDLEASNLARLIQRELAQMKLQVQQHV